MAAKGKGKPAKPAKTGKTGSGHGGATGGSKAHKPARRHAPEVRAPKAAAPKPSPELARRLAAAAEVFQMGGQEQAVELEDLPRAPRINPTTGATVTTPDGAEVQLRTMRAPEMANPRMLEEAPEVKIAKPKPIPSAKDKPTPAVVKPKWVPESMKGQPAAGPKLKPGEQVIDAPVDMGGPVVVKNTGGKFSADLLGLASGQATAPPVEDLPAPPKKGAKEFVAATSNPDDGLMVVASKQPASSKFSLADLEMLKKAIVIKGTGIVNGFNLDAVKWDADGFVPVIAQDRVTGAILGLNVTNREALEKSLTAGDMAYYSKQKQAVVVLGKDSGRGQKVVSIKPDCDGDALLATVDASGLACHKDAATCWTDSRAPQVAGILGEVERALSEKGKKGAVPPHLKDPVAAMKTLVEKCKDVVDAMKSDKRLEEAAGELVYQLVAACKTKGVPVEKVLRQVAAKTA